MTHEELEVKFIELARIFDLSNKNIEKLAMLLKSLDDQVQNMSRVQNINNN